MHSTRSGLLSLIVNIVSETWSTLLWATAFAQAQRHRPRNRRELLRVWFEMPS